MKCLVSRGGLGILFLCTLGAISYFKWNWSVDLFERKKAELKHYPRQDRLKIGLQSLGQQSLGPKNLQYDNAAIDLKSKLKTFVLFIGCNRSGTTLIGSMLDAHPNAIIAHEYHVLDKWRGEPLEEIIRELWNSSAKNYLTGTRRRHKPFYNRMTEDDKKLFDYHIPSQWPGKIKDYLQVIGDKKALRTLTAFAANETAFDHFIEKMNIDFKFIYLYRNPYDTIATMALRLSKMRGVVLQNKTVMLNNTEALSKVLNSYEKHANWMARFAAKFKKDIISINYMDLIAHPQETIVHLCKSLALTCDESYVSDCAAKVRRTSTKTRFNVVWPDGVIEKINTDFIDRNPLFRSFKF